VPRRSQDQRGETAVEIECQRAQERIPGSLHQQAAIQAFEQIGQGLAFVAGHGGTISQMAAFRKSGGWGDK
jgi:hypothetical protein